MKYVKPSQVRTTNQWMANKVLGTMYTVGNQLRKVLTRPSVKRRLPSCLTWTENALGVWGSNTSQESAATSLSLKKK